MGTINFLHIPKTAGTSIIDGLEKISNTHSFNFHNLKHSYFQTSPGHGVRNTAGSLLKKEDIEGPIFAIVRDFESWFISYFMSAGVGWHNSRQANFAYEWDIFCRRYRRCQDVYQDDPYRSLWHHYEGTQDPSFLDANKWLTSNIWQLFDDNENVCVDYVIDFSSLNTGLVLMLQDLGYSVTEDEVNASVSDLNKSAGNKPSLNKSIFNFCNFKDSGWFFKNNESMIRIIR